MLRSIKQLIGDELRATDGEIGHIKDFYFDDQNWVVRYVVVDTGSWLTGRVVLLTPQVFTNFDLDGVCRSVSLTRKQIENSPGFNSHEPVSRQYEEEYYNYYGCPYYWTQGGLAAFSVTPFATSPLPEKERLIGHTATRHRGDAHLRSTVALHGYHIHSDDGAIGHVVDFIVDHETWAISHLIVETGHWFASKEVAIPPQHVVRISYEESTVFVNLTKEAISNSPRYRVPAWAFQDPAIAAGE
jgi:uncharacterized protein YrrD